MLKKYLGLLPVVGVEINISYRRTMSFVECEELLESEEKIGGRCVVSGLVL
jgi:hypothetical protein